jgi:hypothetical protein
MEHSQLKLNLFEKLISKTDFPTGVFHKKTPCVHKPIFIIGCLRSGTSMLFTLLSQHKTLISTSGYPDGEDHTGWVKHGDCVMAGIGNSSSNSYNTGVNGFNACLHMNEEHANSQIIESMHHYYSKEILRYKKHKRILNKQPHLSNKIGYLTKIFPDAKIVHIIRECDAVVASCMAMMSQHPSLCVYWPRYEIDPCLWIFSKDQTLNATNVLKQKNDFFPGSDGSLFVDFWNSINSSILSKSNEMKGQILHVKYEDLVSSPESELERITRFCDLEAFEYNTDQIISNTKSRHASKINDRMRSYIQSVCKNVNVHFGYGKDS